jgi:hypothetical protein
VSEPTSTWKMHIFPGWDNSFINSGSIGLRSGACPTSILTMGFELESHGTYYMSVTYLVWCRVIKMQESHSRLALNLLAYATHNRWLIKLFKGLFVDWEERMF